MDKNDFQKILRKYLQGEASPEEEKVIDAWYSSMEKDGESLNAADLSGSGDFGWRKIHDHIKRSRRGGRQRKLVLWYSAAVAASLIMVVVASVFLIEDPPKNLRIANNDRPSVTWKQYENNTNRTQLFILPDSSKVALEPQGELKFSSLFNKSEREVYLEGEAFFQVTHNANVPFYVHANEVTTKVLGTSFIIKAITHEQKITVVVKTGKVSVFTNSQVEEESPATNEIILTPNQQIVYDKREKEISKILVKKPEAILPEEEIKRMRFEEAPVTEIFKALEKVYGVDIDFDEEQFSACRLTTVINKDDLYGRLDIICNVIGTSYILQADRIVINGAGCKAKMH